VTVISIIVTGASILLSLIPSPTKWATPTPVLGSSGSMIDIGPNGPPVGGQIGENASIPDLRVINVPDNCAHMFVCLLEGSLDVKFIVYRKDNRLRTGVLEEVGSAGSAGSACVSIREPKNFFQYYIHVSAINKSGEFLLSVVCEPIGVTKTISTPTPVLPVETLTTPAPPAPTTVPPAAKSVTPESPLATSTEKPTSTRMPPVTPTATSTPTYMPLATPTGTPTSTRMLPVTSPAAPTPTYMPLATPTGTPTSTHMPPVTPTATSTPSATPTATPTATPATGSICVLAYSDLNGNGLRDLSESLLAGAVITVTNSTGIVAGVHTTDGVHEPYCFSGLALDTYKVEEQNPLGYPNSTTPDIWTTPLSVGSTVTIAFGDQAPPTSTPTATPVTPGTPTATLVTPVPPTATPTTLETPIRRYTPTLPPETPALALPTATPITLGTPIRAYTPTLPPETPVPLLPTSEASESGSGPGTLGPAATTSLPPGSTGASTRQENTPKERFEMGTFLMSLSPIGLALLGLWIITTSMALYLVRHLGYGYKANRRTATAAIIVASTALALAILMWEYPVIPRTQLLLKLQPGVELHQAEAAAHQYSIMVIPSVSASGTLKKSDAVRFSINVPASDDSLVINVNSSEANLEVAVCREDGQSIFPSTRLGNIHDPITIRNPGAGKYYILLTSPRDSTSFTLLAKIESSAPKL